MKIENDTLRKLFTELGINPENGPSSQEEWGKILSSLKIYFQRYDEEVSFLEKSLTISSEEMEAEIQKNKAISMQLAQAGKLASLGTLASGIAHELNNPLAGIKGNCELIVLKTELSEMQKGYVDKVIKLCDRMAGITSNMLRLARQTDDSEMEAIDLRVSLNDCLELLHTKFSNENIKICLDCKSEKPYVMGRSHSLLSIFQNILSNSRDAFLDHSGSEDDRILQIEVESMSDGEFVKVEIADNAGGMDQDTAAKMFDPFYTTKSVGSGTGLGMSITKQIIDEIGGKICVDSVEGVGTRFTLYFPLTTEVPSVLNDHGNTRVKEIESTITDMKVPGHLRDSNKNNVLIIDDETEICEYFSALLQDYYNVTTTTSPEDGIDLLKTNSYDIIISDIKMPKIPGDKVGEFVKEFQPDAELVFISGHINKRETDQMLIKFHPCIFIPKPFPAPVTIINLLKDLMSQKTMSVA